MQLADDVLRRLRCVAGPSEAPPRFELLAQIASGMATVYRARDR
jgi:hypothetical protein